LLLRHALGAEAEAQAVEAAVAATFARRCCTPDLAGPLGVAPARCSQVTAAIVAEITSPAK
jgi:isocitrate/isopropylmalate dehydrogenase